MAVLGGVSAGIWHHARVLIYLLYINEGFYSANSRELYSFLLDPIFHVRNFGPYLLKM